MNRKPIKKGRCNFHEYQSWRFKSPRLNDTIWWSDPGVVQTDRLMGYIVYQEDEFHWKPRKKGIEYRDVTEEELTQLYVMARNFWRSTMGIEEEKYDLS